MPLAHGRGGRCASCGGRGLLWKGRRLWTRTEGRDDAREGRERGVKGDAASRCQSDAPEGGERCQRDAPERDCAQTEGLVRKGLPREGGDCRRIASCQREGNDAPDAQREGRGLSTGLPRGAGERYAKDEGGASRFHRGGLRWTRRRRGRRCANGDAPRGEAGGRPWIDGTRGGRFAGANPAFLEGGAGHGSGEGAVPETRMLPREEGEFLDGGRVQFGRRRGTGCRVEEAGGRDRLTMGTTRPQDELMERGRERDTWKGGRGTRGREGAGTRCARETPV